MTDPPGKRRDVIGKGARTERKKNAAFVSPTRRLQRAAFALLSRPMRILSGIQPSGTLHLGNYFGMMRPAIE